MATTYDTTIGLGTPAHNDPWESVLNANRVLLGAQAAIGSLAVRAAEVPSASLNVRVSAGSFRGASGAIVAYAGTASQALTTATTNYVFLDDAGTLGVNTTGFPANVVRLATVVAGATTITSVADARVPWSLVGVGTPTIAAGTGAGTAPTVVIVGSDRAGLITVTTGTTPATSATVATVTFGRPFGAAPAAVLLTPAGSVSAALSGNAAVYVDSAATTTTAFVLKVGSTALAASTAHKWHYRVEG